MTSISADQAFEIAHQRAQTLGHGGLDSEHYQVSAAQHEGRPAWNISKKVAVLGKQLSFVVDAETGDVLNRRYRGPR